MILFLFVLIANSHSEDTIGIPLAMAHKNLHVRTILFVTKTVHVLISSTTFPPKN